MSVILSYACAVCVFEKDYFVFFFFQAEDGIRDDLVTGVQTCALPIYKKHDVVSNFKLLISDSENIVPIKCSSTPFFHHSVDG